MSPASADRYRALLARVDAITRSDTKTRVLEAIAWPRSVEEGFFSKGAQSLPEVSYSVDQPAVASRIVELDEVERSIDGDDPVAGWLRGVVSSMRDANRLLLAVGTASFYRISRELYGGARTRFHGDAERNVDLAQHLLERLAVHGWDEARDPEPELVDAEAFAAALRERAAREHPGMRLEVLVDSSVTAKVVAGATRVRVRRDATFSPWEAEGLWHHEVETHCLTAQNGAAQPAAPFLRAGGPRSTRTQEGLAVFTELWHHCLSVERMERLAVRVRLVDMAEDGASFLDLYRYLVGRGASERDAFLDAQRVCRGGRVEGGAPFTKDAAYLGGLIDVHAFLSVVVRGGFRDEVELLACGRVDLDDLHALVLLRQMGLVTRPRFIPTWLKSWRALLPSFALQGFLDSLTLRSLEAHYASLIATAAAAAPPRE